MTLFETETQSENDGVEENPDHEVCYICHDDIDIQSHRNVCTLPCNHVLHADCFAESLAAGNTICGMCRYKICEPIIVVPGPKPGERMIVYLDEQNALIEMSDTEMKQINDIHILIKNKYTTCVVILGLCASVSFVAGCFVGGVVGRFLRK